MTDPKYDYYAPYNLPAQQGVPFDISDPENECSTELTFPAWLEDGDYVLQWVTYGVHGESLRFFPSSRRSETKKCRQRRYHGQGTAFLQVVRKHQNTGRYIASEQETDFRLRV